jgi:cob(I)alamin adenosyltransferase
LGETGLFGGARVPKDVDRVEAYGTVDELNAHLGVVTSGLANGHTDRDVLALLTRIQSELFDIGAELATPPDRAGSKLASRVPAIDSSKVGAIEAAIDAFESRLDPLKTFILPGGSPSAAALHVARTVARRAERRVVTLSRQEVVSGEILRYLNRLSDLLFVVARVVNQSAGIADIAWQRGASEPV